MKVSSFAQRRMDRYGLTADQVEYVVAHYQDQYSKDGATIFRGQLPDGRLTKVRVSEDVVVDAFVYSNAPEEK